MLSKIKKSFIIVLLILCLTGCTEPTDTSQIQEETKCGYKYTYGCGFDIASGSTKCGYGYYFVCY